jgi:stage V sporulation protein SpoVS
LSQKPIFSFKDSSFDQTGGTNLFAIEEYGNNEDNTINTYDISTINTIAGGTISRPAIQASSNVAMLSYGNFLSNVKISNCDGPIFIRNFLVDGALDTTGATLAHTTESGFNVVNSDVTLENCAAVRCSKHGFKLINSNVEVRRAIVGARIYDVSSTTTARKTNTNGIGLYAENSLINFIPVSTAYVQYSGVDFISQFAFNDVGIELNNSKITGGNSITTAFTTTNGPTMIQSMYNKKTGLIMNNSIWDHKGGLETFNNAYGIVANNSQLNIPLLTVEYNQEIGLQAYNSDIKFNPELIQPAVGTSYTNTQIGEDYKQFNFHLNGQHMLLDHSDLRYPDSSSLPTKVGNILAGFGFGTYTVGTTNGHLPAFEVRNNSNAELIHAKITTYQTTSTNFKQPGFGTAISVHDNSKVCFKASIGNGTTSYGPTILVGPQSLIGQKGSAVAYASKNSQIEFNGNTLVAQGGVAVLAENNSVINFNPHRKVGKNLDVSSWNLDNTSNHTRVELHAIRACVVVDNNSVLNMEDLGDYNAYWPVSLTTINDYNNANGFGMAAYTSAGYMQFYPNPEDSNIVTGNNLVPAGSYSYNNTSPGYFLTDYTNGNSETNIAAFSKGGICVKAQRGSKVNALNVNFAAGWYNTSGNFFDTSSGNCELLRIWNICQGSELEAAHLSVSSNYPSLTGYYGPSAVYVSGASNTPASGAPSSTPDTSTLSVLDFYGASGTRAAANYGPFRLYFSPHTQAKMLGYVSGTGAGGAAFYGAPYQMLAQGYNPSANLIGSSAFDAIYSGISTSAFYYVSAMLDPGYRNRVRIDESAADTFANARHNAIGKSGRIPLVTIYRSFNSPGSQQYDADLGGYGKGFKSAEIFDLRRYS